MGDFNAQHRSWGSSNSSHFGARILDIIDQSNLCLLNTGLPTRRTQPHEGISAPDLTICSPSLASSLVWSTVPSTYGSDHHPITITFPNVISKQPLPRSPRLKYKLEKVDWYKYQKQVEENIISLPTVQHNNHSECAEALAQLLLKTADDIFPLKNTRWKGIPSPPWWDSECSEAIKKRKEAEKAYTSYSTDENLNFFVETSKTVKKLLKQKKWEGWKAFCASISPDIPPSVVWSNIRKFRSIYKEQTISVVNDSVLEEFLDNLAPPSVPQCYFLENTVSPSNRNQSALDAPFSLSELKGILSYVKDSSPGHDGIPYSFLCNLTDPSLEYFLTLINSILQNGNVPISWRSQEVIPILKPNKLHSDPNGYRPIALSSVLVKLAEHLVKNRLEWYVESNGFLNKNQYGFRKGKSTMDSIAILTTDIRLAFSRNESLLAAFLDIKGAYDNVVVTILRTKLLELEVPTLLVNFILNILSERSIRVYQDESNNKTRLVWHGLPQGSVLSPLLFNIYSYDLERYLCDKNNSLCVLQYADDLLLYISAKSIESISSSLTASLVVLKNWLVNNGLSISVSKSSLVLFSRMRLPPPVTVYYDNSVLPVNNETKFLGIILDAKLTGLSHCYYITAKCERNLNILRCVSGVWWGAHPFSLKLLYNAIIRSILDYGTYFLEPGSVVGFAKLDAIQSKALRIISGAMKTSPRNALQVECIDPPLKLRRQYLCDRYLFRVFQHSSHPLFQKLKTLSDLFDIAPYWTHKDPPCLVNSFRKFVSIQSPVHRSVYLPIFCTNFESLILSPNIHLNLEVYKDDDHADIHFKSVIDRDWNDWHHIYSDASKHYSSGQVGVGVYHHQYKIVQKVKLPPETSTFTGECFGLFKSIEYALLLNLNKTIIFSDSKSALQALHKFPFKNNTIYPIIIKCRKLLYKCHEKKLSVHFAWVPSHKNIEGNEKADRLANEAVDCGDIFPYINYCHDLAALPKSFLKNSWEQIWEISSQSKGKHYKYIQPSIPTKPWFAKMSLTKSSTSIIMRMRLGHVCTPAHLARMHIVNNDMCECGTDVGDLNHIFFTCPIYDHVSFLSDLLSYRVPFPTSINTLLSTNDINVYRILSMYISKNNIKV